MRRGIIAQWDGCFGSIEPGGGFVPKASAGRGSDFFGLLASGTPLVGNPRQASISESLASEEGVSTQQARVTNLEWDADRTEWLLYGPTNSPKEGSADDVDEMLGRFDGVIPIP